MKSKRKKTAEEFQLRLLLVGFINFDDSLSFLDFFGLGLFDFRRPLIISFSLSKCLFTHRDDGTKRRNSSGKKKPSLSNLSHHRR